MHSPFFIHMAHNSMFITFHHAVRVGHGSLMKSRSLHSITEIIEVRIFVVLYASLYPPFLVASSPIASLGYARVLLCLFPHPSPPCTVFSIDSAWSCAAESRHRYPKPHAVVVERVSHALLFVVVVFFFSFFFLHILCSLTMVSPSARIALSTMCCNSLISL